MTDGWTKKGVKKGVSPGTDTVLTRFSKTGGFFSGIKCLDVTPIPQRLLFSRLLRKNLQEAFFLGLCSNCIENRLAKKEKVSVPANVEKVSYRGELLEAMRLFSTMAGTDTFSRLSNRTAYRLRSVIVLEI